MINCKFWWGLKIVIYRIVEEYRTALQVVFSVCHKLYTVVWAGIKFFFLWMVRLPKIVALRKKPSETRGGLRFRHIWIRRLRDVLARDAKLWIRPETPTFDVRGESRVFPHPMTIYFKHNFLSATPLSLTSIFYFFWPVQAMASVVRDRITDGSFHLLSGIFFTDLPDSTGEKNKESSPLIELLSPIDKKKIGY